MESANVHVHRLATVATCRAKWRCSTRGWNDKRLGDLQISSSSFLSKYLLKVIALAGLSISLSIPLASAQDRSLASIAHGATAQERLLMEQIDQLANAGQINEALASLKRLVDQSQGRMIEAGRVQRAATLSVQLHQPIADWASRRLDTWSLSHADKLESVLQTDEQLASASLRALSSQLKPSGLREVIDRYSLTKSATEARLTLCDLYLDRGWFVAAEQALCGPGTDIRILPELEPRQPPTQNSSLTSGQGYPWRSVWPHVQAAPNIEEHLNQTWQSIHAPTSGTTDALRIALLKRLRVAAVQNSTLAQLQQNSQWQRALAERLPDSEQAKLEEWFKETEKWHEQLMSSQTKQVDVARTFGSNYARRGVTLAQNEVKLEVGSWPKWTKPLEHITVRVDAAGQSKPPVGESRTGTLPYYPLVHDGKVYVHELTRITAYDAQTGKAWPTTEPALPLYDSGVTAATYFPFGYNTTGTPRGTMTIEGNRLYARVGPAITGWFGRAPTSEQLSLSSIIALDLERQGSMRPGFPVRLSSDDFPHCEFDGAPAVVGQRVLVSVLARDNVNLRRFVLAIDRDTGAILWRSPVIASGMVSGAEQASLVSHQLLTVDGGRIFVNTNLGAVACLDLETGQIVWLARYQRSTAANDEPYPRPDRYRYRDLTPCMAVGGQIICAPQDCPELFALDAVSGQLLWSTDGEAVDDSNQLLGVYEQNLIVSGDRIYWLESTTGRVLAAFPAGVVGEVTSALPAPRGFGRGLVAGSRVYWPTQNEIFVFDASQSNRPRNQPVAIRERIRLDTRGAEGGNLTRMGDSLIIAGPGRMFVY